MGTIRPHIVPSPKIVNIEDWPADEMIVVKVKHGPPAAMSIRYPEDVSQDAAGKVLLLAALDLLGIAPVAED